MIDFLFGITFGMFGAAVRGSRRGILLVPGVGRLPQRRCPGDLQGLDPGAGTSRASLAGGDQASGDASGHDGSESWGQEVDR